ASIKIGLRKAGICQSIGADLPFLLAQPHVDRCVAQRPGTSLEFLEFELWVRARQKKVPNCGEGVRTVRVRAVCLVAHQRTYWAGPARMLFGGSRIAAAFACTC